MKQTHIILVAAVVALGVAAVVTPIAYKRGYHHALGREKATLILTINALEAMRAGEDATGIVENACFTTANQFLEDDYYKDDADVTAATSRLMKYWDTYWADRSERPYPMEQLEGLLNQHR